jgi:hypothetical protein
VTTDTGRINQRLSHSFLRVLVRCRDCADTGGISGIGNVVNRRQWGAVYGDGWQWQQGAIDGNGEQYMAKGGKGNKEL